MKDDDELEKLLRELDTISLYQVLWYARYKWVIDKIKKFANKFFPLDPMLYRGK